MLDGYAGRWYQEVWVVGETRKYYRIEALQTTRLAGRRRELQPGGETRVRKSAVQFTKPQINT